MVDALAKLDDPDSSAELGAQKMGAAAMFRETQGRSTAYDCHDMPVVHFDFDLIKRVQENDLTPVQLPRLPPISNILARLPISFQSRHRVSNDYQVKPNSPTSAL